MLDRATENQRRADAKWARIVLEAKWNRGRVTGNGARRLRGPFGEVLERQIEGRFNSGPPIKISQEVNGQTVAVETGCYQRHEQIKALIDPSFHPLQDMVRQRSLLYGQPIVVDTETPSDMLTWLLGRSDVTVVLATAQRYMLGLGSVVVRPSLVPVTFAAGEYYPAALDIVLPEACECLMDPSRPGQMMVFVEHRPNHVLAWDLRNPSNPVWGRWRNAEGFWRGLQAEWQMSGPAYPWYYGSEPTMPCVLKTSDSSTAREPLSVDVSEVQSTLDLILDVAWANVVKQAGSFQRLLVLSEEPLAGIAGSMNDPSNLINVSGPGQKSVVTSPDSMDAATKHYAIIRDNLTRFAKRYDSGFEVRDSAAAKSGVALSLELTGKFTLRNQMATQAQAPDQAIIRALIATHNYLVQSGQISLSMVDGIHWRPGENIPPSVDMLIPETAIMIRYPRHSSAVEKAEARATLRESVKDGNDTPHAIWLLDRDLEDTEANRVRADEALRANLAINSALAELGYGLDWSQRQQIAGRSAEAESAIYDVPVDVANTAGQGLMLRDSFAGRAANGKTPAGLKTLKVARSLQSQAPMLTGDVRALDIWLKEHAGDAGKPSPVGQWGNVADPSGPYIEWLMHGGDPAVAWTSSLLEVTA